MKEFYRIGEVSELFDLEISTLRYYDQIQLFQPMKVDSHSGYRQYHISQFSVLSQIRMYRGLGIPIQEIKQRLFNANPGQILEFINDAEVQLNHQVVELQRKLAMIQFIQKDVRKAVERNDQFELMHSPNFVILAHDHEIGREAQIQDMKELAEKAREADPKRYKAASFLEVLSKDDFLAKRRVRLVKGIGVGEPNVEMLEYPVLKSRYCLHCFVEVENRKDLSDYGEVLDFLERRRLAVTGNILQVHVMHFYRQTKEILVAELYIPVKELKESEKT